MRRIIVPLILALVLAAGTAFAAGCRHLSWEEIENKQGGALKRLLSLLILCTAALLVSVPAASAQDKMTVSIQDFFFDPDQLSVAPGTTVTWVNEGKAPHTVTSTDGKELDSATLQPGDTYSFTFKDDDAGETYAYQCTIHPQMTASVNVSGGGETKSSASASMSPSVSASASPSASASASPSASASASASRALPDTGGLFLPVVAGIAFVGFGILAMIAMRRVS
jgi:plastocyanin